MKKISIVGGGAWGTALAQCLMRKGRNISLWAREPQVVNNINDNNENKKFLPGVSINPSVVATLDISICLANSQAVFLVVPTQYIKSVTKLMHPLISAEIPIIICSKGVEIQTGFLLSEIISNELPNNPIAVLSGPTFAAEVAVGLPATVTLACNDKFIGEQLIDAISSKNFRPYFSTDLVGAQIGGAVKNVLAIASGISDGKGLGNNARASIITHGFMEMSRLALAKGAQMETLIGPSGIGDLLLTCTSEKSRNYSLGKSLGIGKTLPNLLANCDKITEGVDSATAIMSLAKKYDVEMPIINATWSVLNNKASIDEAISGLLNRPLKL